MMMMRIRSHNAHLPRRRSVIEDSRCCESCRVEGSCGNGIIVAVIHGGRGIIFDRSPPRVGCCRCRCNRPMLRQRNRMRTRCRGSKCGHCRRCQCHRHRHDRKHLLDAGCEGHYNMNWNSCCFSMNFFYECMMMYACMCARMTEKRSDVTHHIELPFSGAWHGI